MKKQTQINLILLILGFLVSAWCQTDCEKARVVFNGLPKVPIVSKEDELNRWSKLKSAIDMIDYSMECVRWSYFCHYLLDKLKEVKTPNVNEYLWRESAFKVINSSCFIGIPDRVPTVETHKMVCKSRVDQILSSFTSISSQNKEQLRQFRPKISELIDSECFHQDFEACQQLIGVVRNDYYKYEVLDIISYVQSISEISESCAVRTKDSEMNYCKAVENSTDKGNLIRYSNICSKPPTPTPTPSPAPSPSPNSSNGSYNSCKSSAHSLLQNIGRYLNDASDYYPLMFSLRGQKREVESFVGCINKSSDLKNPAFCQELTNALREFYVRATFAQSMDSIRQRTSTLLGAFEDIIYECDL